MYVQLIRLQDYWLPRSDKWQDRRKSEGTAIYEWPCYFLWRALIINSNARLARCLIYQNVAQYGNLHTGTVMEHYNGPDSQRARMLFSQGRIPMGISRHPVRTVRTVSGITVDPIWIRAAVWARQLHMERSLKFPLRLSRNIEIELLNNMFYITYCSTDA